MKKIAFTLSVLLLGGCASTPPFSCDNARIRIEQESANAVAASNEYHAAQGQKDGSYYGVKAARTATCIGSLGLLCGVADTIASDNTRIEQNAITALDRYERSAGIVEGLRHSMNINSCPDIPPPLEELLTPAE